MIAGITTPLVDTLDSMFGPAVTFIVIGILSFLYLAGTKSYRDTKLYKCIMGDKAKPYIPLDERNKAEAAEPPPPAPDDGAEAQAKPEDGEAEQ